MWRKSTYSDQGGADCVEVGQAAGTTVMIRDTKDRDGETLAFGASAWERFIKSL
jgi:Domain of unknown function (DUF397)